MARTALTPTQITRAGVAPTLSAANADGHSVSNAHSPFLHVNNGSGGSITVTILIPKTLDGQSIANSGRQVTVPAGQARLIGPFPPGTYEQADGTVHVNFSSVTSVTVGAFYA